MRLCSEHFETIINFAERHPQIINAFVGSSGHNNSKKLWEQLMNKLNALGYGSLTVNEYKKRITDWKSKTKGKAAEIARSLKKTGGGPGTPLTLSSLEKRLLAIMGRKCFKGDEMVKEIGFGDHLELVPNTSNDSSTNVINRKRWVESHPSTSSSTPKKNKMIEKTFEQRQTEVQAENDIETDISDIENEMPKLPSDHTYFFESQDNQPQKESLDNPPQTKLEGKKPTCTCSKSTVRRRKFANLSEDIRKTNDQTLSVFCQIDNTLTVLNNNINSLNAPISSKMDKIDNNFSKFTDAIITLFTKQNIS